MLLLALRFAPYSKGDGHFDVKECQHFSMGVQGNRCAEQDVPELFGGNAVHPGFCAPLEC